ncbi:MAG: response regulator [Cyclobacteriaceae bacterium]|nr:response regulator [Cyclobacteriaceae bacterium]
MKKILLIEDNEDIRENTAEILELAHYEVLTAPDGKKGVELALEKKPDLIVCDIMMPVLDGYGVLLAVQKNPETQHIPFIFLTAKTERSDLRKGMDLGADDYITKPFNGTELLNAIEGRLKKVELLRQDLSADINGLNELMSASGMKSLTDGRTVNKYKKKQIIYMEGNLPSRLYYVQKGMVRAYKTNELGKELVVGLYKEGDFLGYVPLLEGGKYNETAEAMDDCELALIPREDFDRLMNGSREVSLKFVRLLANNVIEKEKELLNLAYNSLRKKVANALMTLQKKYSESTLGISRENLAAICGTATESVIRTLSDFKDEKLIEIKGTHITILNPTKLEHLVN